jgi:hypothetical protein
VTRPVNETEREPMPAPPWDDYDEQPRDEWAHSLEAEIRRRLVPILELADRVVAYENAQPKPRRRVIQRANYIALHFGFGPGGAHVPGGNGSPAPPWDGYEGSDLDAVTQQMVSRVGELLTDVKTLLDEVIAYEQARPEPRENVLDQLFYLYNHFALGGGGWVHP